MDGSPPAQCGRTLSVPENPIATVLLGLAECSLFMYVVPRSTGNTNSGTEN